MTLLRAQNPVPPASNPSSTPVGGVKAGTGVEIAPDGTINFIGRQDIPSGAVMLFYDATAPTGWTRLTNTQYDLATIRLVTTSGGGTGGVFEFNDIFKSGIVKTSDVNWTSLQVSNTAIVESTMPAHSHNFTLIQARNQAVVGGGQSTRADAPSSKNTSAIGDNGSHSHSLAGTVASGTFLFNLNVTYADTIVARKN